ncbi:hypothetical protein K438DRAFT_1773228 [Mycena galopus ATCC 62051]|nr:hypothetical protein K438DRAFT_1773228 [Mycena galopus ATCC 62051]
MCANNLYCLFVKFHHGVEPRFRKLEDLLCRKEKNPKRGSNYRPVIGGRLDRPAILLTYCDAVRSLHASRCVPQWLLHTTPPLSRTKKEVVVVCVVGGGPSTGEELTDALAHENTRSRSPRAITLRASLRDSAAAEELGIDVYPGFAGAQLLLSPSPDADARKEESAQCVGRRDALRRLKHPHIRAFLANGTRLAYGAHALTEGRLHAVPPAARLSRRGVGWRRVEPQQSFGVHIGVFVFESRAFSISLECPFHRAALSAAKLFPPTPAASPASSTPRRSKAGFAALHSVAQFESTATLEMFRDEEMQTRESRHAPLPRPLRHRLPPLPCTHLWTVRNVRPGVNTRWGARGSVLYAGFDPMLGQGAVDVEAS